MKRRKLVLLVALGAFATAAAAQSADAAQQAVTVCADVPETEGAGESPRVACVAFATALIQNDTEAFLDAAYVDGATRRGVMFAPRSFLRTRADVVAKITESGGLHGLLGGAVSEGRVRLNVTWLPRGNTEGTLVIAGGGSGEQMVFKFQKLDNSPGRRLEAHAGEYYLFMVRPENTGS